MKIEAAFQQAIQDKIFSGAQVILGEGDQTLFSGAYGKLSQQPDAGPVTSSTLFDIASLTKPVCTATLYMMALQEGRISLDDPIQKFLPELLRQEKLTLRQLLSHTSGLSAWLPLFQEVKGKGYSSERLKSLFMEKIGSVPLESMPGKQRIYSDLGYLLLGFALEKLYQNNLSQVFAKKIAQPFKLNSTRFHPLSRATQKNVISIAATEICPWRGKWIQGEVHDDNAFVLGGVAGHAGLFSHAADLEKFLRIILRYKSNQPEGISENIWEQFLIPKDKLGWDTVRSENSQAGRYFSPFAIGHLAFTGCSFWLDLQDSKYIILLTNRVHPSREDERIKAFRPRIHDLLIQSFCPRFGHMAK
jgi:CubicO group peptidase (beta-lactamase class C family)